MFAFSTGKDEKWNELQLRGIYSVTSTKLSLEEKQAISSLSVAAGRELAEMESSSMRSFDRPGSFDRAKEEKRQYAPSVLRSAASGFVNYQGK